MDKEHIKGAADKAPDSAKQAVGKMSDNKKMQAEGAIDKAKGREREWLGGAGDAARRADKDGAKH